MSVVDKAAMKKGGPYDGLYGEAPTRLQVYEKVGILLVGVYERVGKPVVWVSERAQKG